MADSTTQADFTVAATDIVTVAMPEHQIIPSQMQPVYSDFIKHSYLLNTGTWTNVSPLFSVISEDVMNTFLTGTVGLAIGNKIKNFRYFTSKIKLTFMVQGFPLAYGKLVFYADPKPYNMSTGGTFPAGSMFKPPQKCRSMILPHVEIDPSKTEVHELVLECPTPWGVYSLDYTLGSYRIGYQIINPLLSGQTGAPPTITYSIYMSLVDPEMSVLSFTSGSITTKEQTKISSHVSSFSKGMAMMSNIPVLGPFATLASSVSSTVGDALAWFGFSKPVVQNKTNVGIFYSMDEQGVLDGKIHSHTTAMRNDNSVTINPSSIPLASFKDQEIEFLANKQCFVRTLNITTAMASGTIYGVFYLRPENIYQTDSPVVTNGFEPSGFNLVTRSFKRYRCDNKIRLEFIASVFHRATVVCAYFPDINDSAVTMANAVQTVKNWQFQICGNAVYDLEIPYSQPEPFLNTFHTPTGAAPAVGFANGVLVFYVLNPNISNGVGDIYMNIYSGACNLSMGVPSDHMSFYNISLTSKNIVRDKPGPLEGIVFTSGAAPANLVNPMCIKDPHFYQNYFGEECPHTTKELAGRSVKYFRILQNSATVRTTKCYRATVPAIPPLALASGAFPSNYVQESSSFMLLAASYLGFKGSTHITVFPDTYATGTKTVLAAKASYHEGGTVDLVGINTYFLASDNATFAQIYSDTQNFFNLKIPYYFKGMFRPSFPIAVTPVAFDVLDIDVASTSNIQTDPDMQTYFHAGDDFNFVYYRGTPVTIMT